jgi:hypothetical protein
MEKYYVSCPLSLEESSFTIREEAERWVAEHNKNNPPHTFERPAQIYTRAEWEGLHCADAG